MRARWVLVSGLLIAAAAASAVPPGEHLDAEQTSCWECHAPGVWNPAMEPPRVREYRFDPGSDGWVLTAVVQNNWTHDLQNVAGLLVMPDGWSYGGDTNVSQESFQGTMTPGLGEDAVMIHEFDVPPGTQRLTVRASYEANTPHQFDMYVHPGMGEAWGEVVRNGSYEEVTYGPEGLAAGGWGQWQVRLVAHSGLEVPEGIDYEVEVRAEKAPAGAWLAQGADIPAGSKGEIHWPIDVDEDVPERAASLLLFTDMYYEHDDAENPDLAHARTAFTFPVQVRSGSPLFIDEEPDEDDEVIPALPLASLLTGLVLVAARRRA